MPSTRHVSKEQPSATSAKSQHQFYLPRNTHLLITTPSHILTWDSEGIHTLFKSSKNGIVAAQEAKDGSGVLAIADKHVVILHDTMRGQERSWGLDADGDEVRQIEYTADAKSLFLSTTLTSDIQRYSTETSRLLSPARAHASPPVALAVSPTGHLMVSAADDPPVVYLKDLAHNSSPILVKCRASETAVNVIAFHPERPNIFLLAFGDGTLAAFDATRIGRNHGSLFTNQESVNAGEISHIPKLHRSTTGISNTTSITNAAFLPGHKTRAVSVGGDGRCRLVDFVDGGVVIRTWHAKSPVTSVCVLSQKSGAKPGKRSTSTQNSHTIRGPTSTNNLIAIGLADGKVHIYDSVGLLLAQQSISQGGERIISVEWVKGPSPQPIANSIIRRDVEAYASVTPRTGTPKNNVANEKAATSVNAATQRKGTLFEHVGLPPALRKSKDQTGQPTTGPVRRFTIHPDEIEESTVRHTPLPKETKAAPAGDGHYLDLFSPVKQPKAETKEPSERRVASPLRSRPRVSSQTFVRIAEPTPPARDSAIAKPRNLALFPSTDSGSETVHLSAETANSLKKTGRRVSPIMRRKPVAFKSPSRRGSRKSGSFNVAQAAHIHNAKVLAELRQMSATHPAYRHGGVLSAFRAPNTCRREDVQGSATKQNDLHLLHRPADHVETDLNSLKALKIYENVHGRQTWPDDSNQDSSLDGDIWLTSASDEDTKQSRRRRQHHIQRPPARQTSRSRVDLTGTMSTMSTLAQHCAPTPLDPDSRREQVDGSTDEGMYTAEMHLSPAGSFSPSSNDVRELFPRSSSLSPRKLRRLKTQLHRSPPAYDRSLREVALNVALGQQEKSPWARAKAGKHRQSAAQSAGRKLTNAPIQVFEDQAQRRQNGTMGSVSEPHCSVCSPTKARVHDLESEVVRLKGEVLALKSALRRGGVALPTSIRTCYILGL